MSITENSDYYDKNYINIKFNSDDELSLNKTIEFPTMTIVATAFFHENNKHCAQVFLDKYFDKLKIVKNIIL